MRAEREERQPLDPLAKDWFLTGKRSAWFYLHQHERKQVWLNHADAVVAEWVASWPGCRPFAWWYYSAREPRQRLGGIGDSVGAPLWYGLPPAWCWPEYDHPPGTVVIDRADPPRFESEAFFLRRLNLLLPGEARRIRKADFAPEVVA